MRILGLEIQGVDRKEALNRVREFLAGDGQHLIATINPEMLVAAFGDDYFQKVLDQASLKLIDGAGLQIMSFLVEGKWRPRLAGADFLSDLMKLAAETGQRVFFLGGVEGRAEAARDHFVKCFPSLEILAESGGEITYQQIQTREQGGGELVWKMDPGLGDRLRQFKPQILAAALGHKKQELWLAQYLRQWPTVKVSIGVGGAFDFWSGATRRAPRPLRVLGLEWFWRLIIEPWRWRRIWTAVIVFPVLVLIDRFNHKK